MDGNKRIYQQAKFTEGYKDTTEVNFSKEILDEFKICSMIRRNKWEASSACIYKH